jgi:hypothetical protein
LAQVRSHMRMMMGMGTPMAQSRTLRMLSTPWFA